MDTAPRDARPARLPSGSLTAIVDQAVNSGGSFLTTVIMARALHLHGFGTYSLLFAAILTLNGLVNTIGSEPVRTLGVAGSPRLRRQYAGAQLLAVTAVAVPTALLLALALLGFLHLGVDAAAAVGTALLSACLFETMRALGASRHEWRHILIADCAAQGVKLSALALLLASDAVSVPLAFWALALSTLSGALMLRALGIVGTRPTRAYFLQQMRAHLRYGKWLTLESVVFVLSTQLYLYLIALLVDVPSAGGFNAAQTLVNAVNLLWMGITAYAMSTGRGILIEQGALAWRTWLMRTGTSLLVAVALVLVLISLAAHPLLAALFSPRFAQYAYQVPLLALAALATAGNGLLSVAFRTLEMPQMGFRGKALSALVTAVIAYPLVSNLGTTGAAIGMIVTQICWASVYLWGLNRIQADWAGRVERLRMAHAGERQRFEAEVP